MHKAAHAGSFRVLPIKVFLDQNNRMETMRIRNESDEKVTIQIKTVKWDQDERGVDVYEPTKDLIFFPRIFSIEGNEERMVKVGYQKQPSSAETTYRIFIEEIPETSAGANQPALKMILKMSVPVFLASGKTPAKAGEIDKLELNGNSLSVSISNTGASYFFVKNIKVTGNKGNGESLPLPDKHGWYLLKGTSRKYLFDLPEGACNELKDLHVQIETDNEVFEKILNVQKSMCEI
ncbi:molecular chaperone [bacterium]|nr:molecular chaperone [bacterium]